MNALLLLTTFVSLLLSVALSVIYPEPLVWALCLLTGMSFGAAAAKAVR